MGVSFDIVTEDDLAKRVQNNGAKKQEFMISYSSQTMVTTSDPKPVSQPPYMFGSTQIELYLDTNQDYYIVPSVKNRKLSGPYYLQVMCVLKFPQLLLGIFGRKFYIITWNINRFRTTTEGM